MKTKIPKLIEETVSKGDWKDKKYPCLNVLSLDDETIEFITEEVAIKIINSELRRICFNLCKDCTNYVTGIFDESLFKKQLELKFQISLNQ